MKTVSRTPSNSVYLIVEVCNCNEILYIHYYLSSKSSLYSIILFICHNYYILSLNRSYIFGLSENQGKNAIDRFCRQLFLRAESRRLGKTIMFVKCKGPIVFSDSSDESDEELADEMDTLTKETASEEETGEIESSQANKRLKVA